MVGVLSRKGLAVWGGGIVNLVNATGLVITVAEVERFFVYNRAFGECEHVV